MGQIQTPPSRADIILTATDRLVASNADGGLAIAASHVVLLGEDAGENLGPLSYVYIIGADSGAGGMQSALQNGTVMYGGLILSALTNASPVPVANDGPITAIGYNILPAAINRVASSVLIGANIGANAPTQPSPFDTSVVAGNDALGRMRTLNASGGTFCRSSVILGYRALRGGAFTVDGAGASVADSIFIGNAVGENAGFDDVAPGTVIGSTIAIGTRALRSVCAGSAQAVDSTVAIGHEVATGFRSGQGNVFLGAGITTPATDCLNDVLIGSAILGAHANNTGQNVVVGASASVQGLGSRCIFLGSGANGAADIGGGSDHFLLETVNLVSGARRNLMYGNMGTLTGAVITACGLVFGLSGAANRDLPGMNIIKLINGARDAGLTAPVGGGYFYSTGGELHWVSTGNFDYALTPTASLGNFAVAALPAAPALGAKAYANDATAPAFGAAVVGGGAVFIPVFWNGAAWIVG